MSPSELKLLLESQFDLICFEDLANLRKSHAAAFNLFKKNYRNEFKSNQRLVLYSGHDIEQEFVNHIQEAATVEKIGNFFILIITPYNLTEKLIFANQLFANDEVTIKYQKLDLTSTIFSTEKNFIQDYSSICAFPFSQVDVCGTNIIKPCCKIQINENIDSKFREKSYNEIFNSATMKNIRRDLLQGKKIKECTVCWESEKNHTTSLRKHSLELLGNDLHYLIDNPKLEILNFMFSNTCNFSCRICSPYESSKIAAEEISYNKSKKFETTLIDYKNILQTKEDFFLSDLKKTFEHIKTFHIFGGEPLLWKNLPYLLEELIRLDYAKNISLRMNTNASIYNEKIISLMKQFKKVEILLSIDDIETRFEIQRGGNWNDVVQNLKLYGKDKSKNFIVKIAPTVNIQNLLYLDQLINFCNTNDFSIVWCYLENPKFLCIDYVTDKVKQLVVKKYLNHENVELQSIAKRVKNNTPVNGNEFISYMTKIDLRRTQNFREHHKEIFDAMLG